MTDCPESGKALGDLYDPGEHFLCALCKKRVRATFDGLHVAVSRHTIPGMKAAPSALDGLSAGLVATFERDFRASRHRRQKCSREDFASGYVTCLEAHWLKGRKRRPPAPPEDQVDGQTSAK
jgi:hypothetical protein